MTVSSERPREGTMERDEWLKRYADRIMAVAGVTRDFALASSKAEAFEILSEDYEDDPEGAADMEMSYWDE
jgi:hypothetical protein